MCNFFQGMLAYDKYLGTLKISDEKTLNTIYVKESKSHFNKSKISKRYQR